MPRTDGPWAYPPKNRKRNVLEIIGPPVLVFWAAVAAYWFARWMGWL